MGILILNIVTLYYASSLKLPVRITFGQFTTLFETYREDSGEVYFLIKPHCVFNNTALFSDTSNIPDTLFQQLFTFSKDCLEGFRIIINLLTGQ